MFIDLFIINFVLILSGKTKFSMASCNVYCNTMFLLTSKDLRTVTYEIRRGDINIYTDDVIVTVYT